MDLVSPPSRRVARLEEFEELVSLEVVVVKESGSSASRTLKRGDDWITALPCLSLLLHLARGLERQPIKHALSHTFK